MNTYTITAVGENVRDWNSEKGGPMKSYRVTLRNQDGRELGNVEITRKETTPAPKPGDTVEGTVDKESQYGPKFKAAQRFGAGSGGGFRGKTAEERRSIAMQSSLARGVDVVRLCLDAGLWKPHGPDDCTRAALKVADQFYERVQRAEAAGS